MGPKAYGNRTRLRQPPTLVTLAGRTTTPERRFEFSMRAMLEGLEQRRRKKSD